MTPYIVILSFLAARRPSAYTAAAIADRVNLCGRLDKRMDEAAVERELLLMADRYALAVHAVYPTDGQVYWNATPAGVEAWRELGSPHVA